MRERVCVYTRVNYMHVLDCLGLFGQKDAPKQIDAFSVCNGRKFALMQFSVLIFKKRCTAKTVGDCC